MLVFASQLIHVARKAGMKVPVLEKADEEFDGKEYPHFQVFCRVQLCRPIDWTDPEHNAKVIADISDEAIKEITLEGLINRGLRIHFSS